MILPNKLINFDECILSKTVCVLDIISEQKIMFVSELYQKVEENFEDINEFIHTLDVLFVLNKIEYNEKMKVIEYVI